jgi:hypothetical protein
LGRFCRPALCLIVAAASGGLSVGERFMRRVILLASLLTGAAFFVLRLSEPTTTPLHFSAGEMALAAGFVTLAIAVLLRD